MYADSKYDDKGKPTYHLTLAGEGTSAKCPPDIFGEDVLTIPNDAQEILTKLQEFAN